MYIHAQPWKKVPGSPGLGDHLIFGVWQSEIFVGYLAGLNNYIGVPRLQTRSLLSWPSFQVLCTVS